MSIRHYCDGCGVRIKQSIGRNTGGRLRREDQQIMVEIIVGTRPTWNSGDQCLSCIVHAVLHAAYLAADNTAETAIYRDARDHIAELVKAAREAEAAPC